MNNQQQNKPIFLAKGQGFMWLMEIHFNNKEWTSYSTNDHIRDKDKIIAKAIQDLKEEGLSIGSSEVNYWDTRWNVPLY